MAKHKKKTSEPTPGSKDSINESSEDNSKPTPEIDTNTSPIIPPNESSGNQTENSEKEKKLNKLFWLRVILAVVAGTIATFIFEDIEGEERRWASIAFMIIIFAGTIVVAKNMKMQLPASDRKKIVTQGIGSYIFLYLFTWIVTYTIVHAGTVSDGVNL